MRFIHTIFQFILRVGFVLFLSCPLLGIATAQVCVEPQAGLVSWWSGNGNTRDTAGNHHGTLRNGASFASGMVRQAFNFEGSNDFVRVRDNHLWTFGIQDFTIDLWVNFHKLKSRAPFVGHDEGGGERNKWIFWYDEWGHGIPGPALRFIIDSPTLGPRDTIIAPWTPDTEKWYHVAVTRSGSTYKLYIEGAQVATATNTSAIPDAAAPLTIGGAEGYSFAGRLDEVDIYNRALTAAEIEAIFAAGSAGKCQPVGGAVKGVSSAQVVCTNLTTGQTISVPEDEKRSWNCEAAGLIVDHGDRIRQTVTGDAD